MIFIYTCSQEHTTVTKNEVPGAVLPNFILCPYCKDMATCNFDSPQQGTPTHEWFIPPKKGRGITKEVKRQFKQHGIYLREIKTL